MGPAGLRFGIVVSRFNGFITERLSAAAVDALQRAGAKRDVDVVHVPGAFELPLAAKKLAATSRYMRFDRHRVRFAWRNFALRLCLFGDSARLAAGADGFGAADYFLRADLRYAGTGDYRAGLKGGNKGFESGLAAIEMARFSEKLRGPQSAVAIRTSSRSTTSRKKRHK